MTSHPSLRVAIASIALDPPDRLRVRGRVVRLDVAPRAPAEVLEKAVAEALYVTLHCRVASRSLAAAGSTNWTGARDFADRLSRANSGHGTWQAGWVVRELPDAGRIVVERHGVIFWADEGDFRPPGHGVVVAEAGRVRIPKEYFELASGFYLAHGNADDTRDEGDVARIYWHVVPAGAELLMGTMTRRLNATGIPFQLKVLSEPLRYQRADPAVLYLARGDYQTALPVLREVCTSLGSVLLDSVSLLVKPLAPGVGVAEDPGDGSSYGEHRTRMLASVFCDPSWREVPAEHRAAEMARRLAGQGFDLDRLFLQPGSIDRYPSFDEGPPA